MNSTSEETKTGVQPLDADDANLADLSSDEELSGASEADGPLHQAEEAYVTPFDNFRGWPGNLENC